MELKTSLSSIIEKLEKFKSQYEGDDVSKSEYKDFIENINANHIEVTLLSDEIMPKVHFLLI